MVPLLGRFHDGLFKPDRSINGVLGGLVAITAGCDVLSTYGAVFMGISAGFVVFYSAYIMENYFKLDDAVGAVPVHGFCGAWGTIMLAVFAPTENLPAGDWLSQISIQIQGVIFAFLWAFSLGYIFFKCFDKISGIRISAAHELEGLNSAAHGTTLGTGLLQKHLNDIVNGSGDLTARLDTTTGDNPLEVSLLFNKFISDIQRFVNDVKLNAIQLKNASGELINVVHAMAESSTDLTEKSGFIKFYP